MTSRYYDFDAAVSEPEPITVHLLGRDWTLPGSVPAGPILAYERFLIALDEHRRSGSPEPFTVDDDFSVESMARQLAGDTALEAWLKAGIDYPTLQRTVGLLRRIRMGQDPGLGEPAAAAPKATAAKSKGGRSRSGTSSARGPR